MGSMMAIDARQIKLKAISQLRYLLLGACLLSGWLTGNSIDKYLIRVPAWRRFDLIQWAEFTRHEYLNYGFYVYLTEALGCFVLLLIALDLLLWVIVILLIFSIAFSYYRLS